MSREPLSGAIFDLYSYVDGTFSLVETLSVDANGRISFPELQTEVLYKLVEEKSPDGYAIITKDIYFKLVPAGKTVSFTFCDELGHTSQAPPGVTGEYVTGSKLLTLTVENLRGYALPSTGGPGTLLYILCGLFLVVSPLVYGFSLRRRYVRRFRK